METTTFAALIGAAWANAPPGRESVAQNELLRELWRWLTSEEQRPIRLPPVPHLHLVRPR